MNKIIEKIKNSGLTGRSGSRFPAWIKWDVLERSKSDKKYIICNASEGDPGTFKDRFLLKCHPGEVMRGIKIALDLFKNSYAYIYLKPEYLKEFRVPLKRLADERIALFEKKGGYIGGEETAAIEVIEGNFPEPRFKPPFPAEKGLWGYPTLVHNVETFYFISKIERGQYEKTRCYSISGDIKNKGTFELPESASIKRVLEETGNLPAFDFFLQVGGFCGGKILTSEETSKPLEGLGSIIVYNKSKTDPYSLMEKWSDFLLNGNCDKCVPCREGLYRISEMIKEKNLKGIDDLFFVLQETSFCPLGKNSVIPFKTLIEKIIR